MSRIVIANPLPGGQGFTSIHAAQRYCDSGIAYYLRDGRLKFRKSHLAQRIFSDVHIDSRAQHEGAIWWDGDDPGGMHKPGEVVS